MSDIIPREREIEIEIKEEEDKLPDGWLVCPCCKKPFNSKNNITLSGFCSWMCDYSTWKWNRTSNY